jgi:hypothetical protein
VVSIVGVALAKDPGEALHGAGDPHGTQVVS